MSELLAGLLQRAARDGHTWMPTSVLAAGLAVNGISLEDALRDSEAVVMPAEGVVALASLAQLEDDLAEAILAVQFGGGGVSCVLGPAGHSRRETAVAAAKGGTVLDDAERLDLITALAAVSEIEEGASLVLAGDDMVLAAQRPGNVLGDMATVVPALRIEPPLETALDRLRAGVRQGELPDLATLGGPEHSVVVVPVADDAGVARKVGQLLETSIPRAFGVPGAAVRVVSTVRRGAAGSVALAAALGHPVLLPEELAAGAEDVDAAVLVVPAVGAGMLHRDAVLTALQGVSRHLSVVMVADCGLAAAVAAEPHRPRRTRLAALLSED